MIRIGKSRSGTRSITLQMRLHLQRDIDYRKTVLFPAAVSGAKSRSVKSLSYIPETHGPA